MPHLPLSRRSLGLVSVIVRTQDRPRYLRRALASLARQTYSDLEVLVVNDGHRSIQPVLNAYRKVLRIVSIPLRHGSGRARAANVGLQHARGRWICFLDDDDLLTAESIAARLAAFDRETVLVYGRVLCLGRGRCFSYARPYDPVRLRIENYIPIHAALFRREAIERCRFDERFDLFEDWDFWLQLQRLGPFKFIDALVGFYDLSLSGAGGRFHDEEKARGAFVALLEKWLPEWGSEGVAEIVACARLLERHLARGNRHLVELEARRAHLEERLSKLEAEREELREQLAESETEREVLKERLFQAEARARRQEEELRQLQETLERIYRSRSWRLTAPLRELGRLLRREVTFQESLFKAALLLYRSPLQRPLRRLPVPFKQRLKAWLLPKPKSPPVRPVPGRAPRVSIIIPVYNHARFLPKCLESALSQSYPHLEVIACDDASTEREVQAVLEQFQRRFPQRLKVLRNGRNLGIAETQNRLLEASSGEIIAFLDCDDYLAPNAIERCLEVWREETVYLHTGRINVDGEGREVSRISFEHLPRRDYFQENLERMFATHLKLIRRDAIARVGLFDPRFDAAQDYDLLMRIAFHYPSRAFLHLPEFLYFHRFHPHQTTHLKEQRQKWATEKIQEEARLRAQIRRGDFERLLSIVMLSFGKPEQTLEALESLRETVAIPHEIVLLDNGSDGETVSFLKRNVPGRFPNVRLLFSPENLGPALGRRRALEQARGDLFLIFDNDETAEKGWVEELLVRALSQERVGSVCAKVLFPDRTLQFTGGYLEELEPGMVRLALYDRGRFAEDLRTARFRECDWNPIGATLFTVNPAPFLHEGYPNVFEDVAVSMALRKRGFRCLNAPGAWVVHHHFTYRQKFGMKQRYLKARYDPRRMAESIRSFYRETGLLIFDEYIWRENGLIGLSREEVLERLGLEPVPA